MRLTGQTGRSILDGHRQHRTRAVSDRLQIAIQTHHLPPSRPHMGRRAEMGQAGKAGQDAISKWAGNTTATQSRGASPVPSHVGRLETPGPLRTHRRSSQPHYTTGLWPALGAASPPRHHDDVRPRWTSPSPEEACHAAAALPCPAHMCLCALCACVPWARDGGVHHARTGPIGTCCREKSRHCALEWLHCPHARPVPRLCIAPVSTAAIYPSASPLNGSGG